MLFILLHHLLHSSAAIILNFLCTLYLCSMLNMVFLFCQNKEKCSTRAEIRCNFMVTFLCVDADVYVCVCECEYVRVCDLVQNSLQQLHWPCHASRLKYTTPWMGVISLLLPSPPLPIRIVVLRTKFAVAFAADYN